MPTRASSVEGGSMDGSAGDLLKLPAKFTLRNFLEKMICENATFDCYDGSCATCGVEVLDLSLKDEASGLEAVNMKVYSKVEHVKKDGSITKVVRRVVNRIPLATAIASLQQRSPGRIKLICLTCHICSTT